MVAVYASDICAQVWGIRRTALISGLRKLTELRRRVGWPYFLDIHLAPSARLTMYEGVNRAMRAPLGLQLSRELLRGL